MSLRVQATALIVGAFSITLGILLWPERHAALQGPPAVPLSMTQQPDSPVSAPAAFAGPHVAATAPAAPAGNPAAPRVEEVKTPAFSQVPVPAYVVLAAAADQAGQTLTLRNSSARPLDVTVTASNPHTGHQGSAQVNLPPFADVPIDTAQILVEKGDLLTLHGPPFADREVDTDADNPF